ncbi:hypothetical protein V2J09_020294 [Rumex salicifolius]
MGTLTASTMLIPLKLKPSSFCDQTQSSLLLYRGRPYKKKNSISPVMQIIHPLFFFGRILRFEDMGFVGFEVMRLFGPAIFEASKLKVLFLGVDDKKHPAHLPRTYTLTHSDITAKLTLAISQTINNSQLQGWSNKLYRDEVVAEWKKVKGKMSLHVHCHISAYPELEDALVWVYFHSNTPEFNKVECWGPLKAAEGPVMSIGIGPHLEEDVASTSSHWEVPRTCKESCACCFPPMSVITWSHDHHSKDEGAAGAQQQQGL